MGLTHSIKLHSSRLSGTDMGEEGEEISARHDAIPATGDEVLASRRPSNKP